MAGNIVMDFDDVLVDLSSEVYARIRKNWRIFSRWLVDAGPLSPEELQSRRVFSLNEWLIKKEYSELDSKDYVALQLEIFNNMKKLLFTKDLYDELEPTELAKRTLMNPLYIDNSRIKKVYIISRNINKEQAGSKKRFIEKYFKHPKIEYISVMSGSKQGILDKYSIKWDQLIDDELKNIYEMIIPFQDPDKLEFNMKGKEILIPEFGYNKVDQRIKIAIEEGGGTITYYNPNK